MPSILRCNEINLNDREMVIKVKNILQEIIATSPILKLNVSKKYYFKIEEPISSNPGWYIILNKDRYPLYVGKAENLNHRLNSEDGTRDQFANPQRSSDSERNFIKKFLENGVFEELFVCIIKEKDFCDKLGFNDPLKNVDKNNIEKIINIFRCNITKELK